MGHSGLVDSFTIHDLGTEVHAMARRQNYTFSDQQSGRLQQRASATRSVPAANAQLPEIGASIALGAYGTCTVLQHEVGPGGITMLALKCTGAGHKTFIGQEFKLSGPFVTKILTERRQRAADEQLSWFFGTVSDHLSRLGPSAWLPFLQWFQTVKLDALPAAEDPPKSHGPIAELYALHERTLRGFAAQPPVDQRVSFSVTLERTSVRVTDDIPAKDIHRIAAVLASEPSDDHAWRRYRRFVGVSITRQVEAARRLVQYAADSQRRWLQTGHLLDQQRLTRSSTGLVQACDAPPNAVRSLAHTIGPIRVGDREVEFESFFTKSDFEREHVVVALVEVLTTMGVTDPERITLAQERELRERADGVLNAEMPAYLKRSISDARFQRYLAVAAAQAKPSVDAVAASSRLWEAEEDALRVVFRRHGWRYSAVAATMGITVPRLAEQVRQHDLTQVLLDDRHEFVRRTYLKAAPDTQTYDELKMTGVRAVARALHVEPATELDTKQFAQDWVREALAAADAPRAGQLQSWQVESALSRHRGSIRFAAHALHVRQRTLIELLDRFQLWERVDGREDLKRARGIPVR